MRSGAPRHSQWSLAALRLAIQSPLGGEDQVALHQRVVEADEVEHHVDPRAQGCAKAAVEHGAEAARRAAMGDRGDLASGGLRDDAGEAAEVLRELDDHRRRGALLGAEDEQRPEGRAGGSPRRRPQSARCGPARGSSRSRSIRSSWASGPPPGPISWPSASSRPGTQRLEQAGAPVDGGAAADAEDHASAAPVQGSSDQLARAKARGISWGLARTGRPGCIPKPRPRRSRRSRRQAGCPMRRSPGARWVLHGGLDPRTSGSPQHDLDNVRQPLAAAARWRSAALAPAPRPSPRRRAERRDSPSLHSAPRPRGADGPQPRGTLHSMRPVDGAGVNDADDP